MIVCIENADKEASRELDGATPRRKVLLVDDSITTLFMEQMVLSRSANVDVLTAVDGEEAVRIALAERPDLIVMDAVMPKMNGVQACRAIRAAETTRDIPIILVIARDEDDSHHGGLASGCTGYVTKPIDAVQLAAAVHKVLQSKA